MFVLAALAAAPHECRVDTRQQFVPKIPFLFLGVIRRGMVFRVNLTALDPVGCNDADRPAGFYDARKFVNADAHLLASVG